MRAGYYAVAPSLLPRRLAEQIAKDVMSVLTTAKNRFRIEEIGADDWAEKVYRPDMVNNWDKLYKKPGYTM